MTILLVFGSRTWRDRAALWNAIGEINPSVIIEGEAEGADTIVRQWAQFYRRGLRRFHAQWGLLGFAAGPIRNTRMLEEGRPDRGLGAISGSLFSSYSKGSQDMVNKLIRADLPMIILRGDGAVERDT